MFCQILKNEANYGDQDRDGWMDGDEGWMMGQDPEHVNVLENIFEDTPDTLNSGQPIAILLGHTCSHVRTNKSFAFHSG